MHHQLGVGQGRHVSARAAGVVEVDVGEENVIDRLRREPQFRQRGEKARQRAVVGGVDDRGATAFDDEMHGGKAGAHVTGIDGMNAAGKVQQSVRHFLCSDVGGKAR